MSEVPSQPQPPSRTSHVRFGVLAWLCAAAIIVYISRSAFGVAESTIRGELKITKDDMGTVMMVFFLFYSLFQIPTGWLGDRCGSRIGLLACSVLWSVAIAGIGLAESLAALIIAAVANGIAQAGLFPCCSISICKWFPRTERARANGPLGACMSIGGAIGSALTGRMIQIWEFSWRDVFLCYSGLGLVWGIGFYAWFRNRPQDHSRVSPAELEWIRAGQDPSVSDAATREPTPWLAIVSSPAMWCICSQQFFRAAAFAFLMTWFPTFLQEARGATLAQAGTYAAWPLLGVVLGNLIGGDLSDRIMERTGSRNLARRGVAIVALTICGLLMWTSLLATEINAFIAVVTLGTFFFAVSSPCSYTITIDMGGRHVATVFSSMNLAGNLGAAFFPKIAPKLQEAFGWNPVIMLFGGMFIAAAAMWLLLKPNGSIFEQSLIPVGPTPPSDDLR